MKFKKINESEIEGVDLFETPELIPTEVKEILDKYEEEANGDELSYTQLAELHAELEVIGYTFDYYLDAVPYDLRKIGEVGKVESWEINLRHNSKIKSFESFVNEELMSIDITIDKENIFPGANPKELENTYGISCELNSDGKSMNISGSRRNVLDYLDDYGVVVDINGTLIESTQNKIWRKNK